MRLIRTGRRAIGKAGFVIARQILLVAVGVLTILPTPRATAKTPKACPALQAKYPSLNGKTLVNAVNAHTPGYEAPILMTRANTSVSTSILANRLVTASGSKSPTNP
jgi:hypothetical protein